MSDRYLKIVLTIIALELGWLALGQATPQVSAQAQPTRVVITGVELPSSQPFVPVGVLGAYRQIPQPLQQQMQRLVVNVDTQNEPLRIQTIGQVTIRADKPLLVESVKYTPGQRPGE
jgi:hypothetical protein